MSDNDGFRFDRLPGTPAERSVEGRPTRGGVVGFFEERFGVRADTFAGYSFW